MNVLNQFEDSIKGLINPQEKLALEEIKSQLDDAKKQVLLNYIEKNPQIIPTFAGISLIEKEGLIEHFFAEGLGKKITSKFYLGLLDKLAGSEIDSISNLYEKINEITTLEDLENLKIELSLLNSVNGGVSESEDSSALEVDNNSKTNNKNQVVIGGGLTENIISTSANGSEDYSDIPREIVDSYEQLKGKEIPDIIPFAYAMQGYEKLKSENRLKNTTYLTVVDYSKSNKENRFYVINVQTKKVEYAVPVGHGKKSGGEFAASFSNTLGSNQSSLGFYLTPERVTNANTKKWSGLLLSGIEDSNTAATERGIYIHPAPVNGSEGCFTLPEKSSDIMNKIKGTSLVFSYYPDSDYLASSQIISDQYKMAA